ncbi:MAG: sugar phosphate isomerase/epimerase, partial [Roseiflexaceae bacterium]|nr:sugar phosphate isomerase/epimerase [Roseiflexaceae bacterium]
AAQLGAPLVVLHASYEPIADHTRADRLVQAQQQINALTRLATDQDCGLAIELLPRTCLGNRVDELLLLASALGPTSGGVCLDTNHGMDRYRELPGDIQRLRPVLRALHISDYDGVDEQHQLPGTGVVDWAACFRALREIGYRGPCTYECALAGATPQERLHTLAENFAWITRGSHD